MEGQVKVKCGDCGFEFMSGALPANRRCKNQNPVCNSAKISEVKDDSATAPTEGVECEGCIKLLQKVADLEKGNTKLQEDLKAAKKVNKASPMTGDIIFEVARDDPFGKGMPTVIGKATKGARELLEKYIQRAEGSQNGAEFAKTAKTALDKLPKLKKK